MIAKLATLEGIAGVQAALQDIFPYMERSVETTVILDAADVGAKTEQATSWHFKDENDNLLVINVTSISLSVPGANYRGAGNFFEKLVTCLDALVDVIPLVRYDRIGVRYLDIVGIENEFASEWRSWFKGEFVGWPSSPVIGGRTELDSTISQTQLKSEPTDELAIFPADVHLVVRHGVAGAGSVVPGFPPINLPDRSFLLDLDIFVHGGQQYEHEKVIRQLSALHSQIERFFRWTMTEEGEAHFGLEEV